METYPAPWWEMYCIHTRPVTPPSDNDQKHTPQHFGLPSFTWFQEIITIAHVSLPVSEYTWRLMWSRSPTEAQRQGDGAMTFDPCHHCGFLFLDSSSCPERCSFPLFVPQQRSLWPRPTYPCSVWTFTSFLYPNVPMPTHRTETDRDSDSVEDGFTHVLMCLIVGEAGMMEDVSISSWSLLLVFFQSQWYLKNFRATCVLYI